MKVVLLSAVFLMLSAPAVAAMPQSLDSSLILATEAETEGEEAPPTTTVSEGGIAPAELVPPVEEVENEDQWTAKFLAPTVAILGALGVVAAFILYGIRLRGRYRVVE
ncbi:MAG: hypothetical protein HKN91_13855 [Acidimicrobiia bacterium]|nr:hypothetical protein [Acidimicrobiia bacterium]